MMDLEKGEGVEAHDPGEEAPGKGVEAAGEGPETAGEGVDHNGEGVKAAEAIDEGVEAAEATGKGVDHDSKGPEASGEVVDHNGEGAEAAEANGEGAEAAEANGEGAKAAEANGEGAEAAEANGEGSEVVGKGLEAAEVEIEEVKVEGNTMQDEIEGVQEVLKNIQISEWSLSKRIEVCKLLLKCLYGHGQVDDMVNKWMKSKAVLVSVEEEYAGICNNLLLSESSQSSSSTLKWSKKQPHFNWAEMTNRLESMRMWLKDQEKEKIVYGLSLGAETEFEFVKNIYDAIEKGQVETFKEYMNRIPVENWGFSLREYNGATPLHWAVLHGQYEMVSFMRISIKKRFDEVDGLREVSLRFTVNAQDKFGFTPLHLVVFPYLWQSAESIIIKSELAQVGMNCAEMIIEDLFRLDASNINSTAKIEWSFAAAKIWTYKFDIHYATRTGSTFDMGLCVDNFLSKTFDLYPIHLAVRFSQPSTVKKLLEKWPEVAYSRIGPGNSTLHLAAWGVWKDNEEVMRLLLEHLHCKPDHDVQHRHNAFSCNPDFVNVVDHDYQTPLHIAAFNGNYNVVDALLKCPQIKVNVRNQKGCTPSQMAIVMCKAREHANKLQLTMSTYFENSGPSNYVGKCLKGRCSECKSNVYKVISLFDGESQKIVQLSEWSLEHKRIVFEMEGSGSAEKINSEEKNVRPNYSNEWFNVLRDTTRGTPLRRWNRVREFIRHPRLFSAIHDNIAAQKVSKLIKNIYDAIETGRLDDFKRLMKSIPVKHWSLNPGEYKGATPLHWAVLHGQNDIVSFMSKKIKSDDSMTYELRLSIVNAHDEYGFTPLHLVAFPSLWNWLWNRQGRQWTQMGELCTQLIGSLQDMGAKIPNNNTSKDMKSFTIRTPLPTGFRTEGIHHLIYLAVWFSHPLSLEKLLTNWPRILTFTSSTSGDTIFHDARAWIALIKQRKDSGEIFGVLSKHLGRISRARLNSRNNQGSQTPLHCAVLASNPDWVEVLLQFPRVEVELRDRAGCTAREIAALINGNKGGNEDMEEIIHLIDCKDPRGLNREIEAMQRERQVYVDAANAILVGAALIASASFGAWLQPPLGYKDYYSGDFLIRDNAAPPDTYESFVAIKQYWIVQMFWIFNSLSFFFSLATVIAGADAALPQQGLELRDAVESVRIAVKRAAWLLSVAILFVVGTFLSIGFAVLPHIEIYKINMYFTMVIGLSLCGFVLVKLVQKLWVHNPPADMNEYHDRLRHHKSFEFEEPHLDF